MTLRTVNPYTSYQTLLDLQRVNERMAVLSEQISSGSRLTRLGDDPTACALVVNFQSSIDRNTAYIAQAKTAASLLASTETALSSLNDSVTRLLEIGEQGLSDTTTESGRSAIAQEADGILDNVLSLANTQAYGKYLFAGTQTTTQPFSETAGAVTYAGDGNRIDLAVSSSTSIATNLAGDDVFFGDGGQGSASDLFQQIADLRDALTANDTAAIQVAFDNLKTIQSRLNDQLADVGGRQATLESLQESLSSYNLSLQTIQNSYESLDYAAATTEYSEAQTIQQASLSVLASRNDLSLFDFIG